MAKPTPNARDYSDPMEIALLLCRAAAIDAGDERTLVLTLIESYLRKRAALSGNYHRLREAASFAHAKFSVMPIESFEAALHLHARAGKQPANLAPGHLRGLTEEQIAAYVISLQTPPPRKRTSKRKPSLRS